MIERDKLDLRRLRWVAKNIEHIGRENHRVTPPEVEQVVFSPSSRTIAIQSYANRVIIVGPTRGGRMIIAVLDPEGDGVWYCVSSRPASPKERRMYQEEMNRRSQP